MGAVDEFLFHRIAHGPSGAGIFAELYDVARPVTAHRHDFYEIAFALAGSGEHEDAGGRLPILSGDVWMIEPGQWHAYPLVGGGLQVFNLLLAPAFLAAYGPALISVYNARAEEEGTVEPARYDGRFRQPPRAGATSMARPDPARNAIARGAGDAGNAAVRHIRLLPEGLERVRTLLLALASELRAVAAPGQSLVCAGLVLQVLGLLDRYGAGGATESAGALAARADAGLIAAVRLIDARYDESLTLADLAHASGYAPTYLVRKFRRYLGIPPIDYLNQVRLQHACALLETTDLPITTIGQQVGFSDSRYFATRFRRALGLTPREFRARALLHGTRQSALHEVALQEHVERDQGRGHDQHGRRQHRPVVAVLPVEGEQPQRYREV